LKCVLLLVGMGAWVFISAFFKSKGDIKKARKKFSSVYSDFIDGEVFSYACLGVPVLFFIDFFFIQKSLIQFINFYNWDPVFAAWDKLVHFGHYPHEFLLWAFKDTPAAGFTFDVFYYFWFVVLYLGVGYNLFLDTDRKRRLRFYWVFFLTWTIIGSALATWWSSVGPLFYHNFYPKLANPYAALVTHFDTQGPEAFRIAHRSRELLLHWATNGNKVNINALSAMPSMHVAIAWLMVLYAWNISRGWMIAALVFCTAILTGSVYFGFHYAVDGYVSIALVSLMWWGAGKLIPEGKPLKRL